MPFDIDEPIQEDYIMGKPSRAKDKQIDIKEINAESGRITIEGRIISCECKETKSGKGMLVFEIYDGTVNHLQKMRPKEMKYVAK